MVIKEAEAQFTLAMQKLEAGRPRDALSLLSSAMDIEARHGNGEPGQARYLSYYGLCLGLTRSNTREALRCCREAAKREDYRPNLWCNVGRVALSVGHRGEAYRAFQRGLEMQADHPVILRELRRMGTRKPPVLTFLDRSHPLNVLLGRMRAVEIQPLSRAKTTETPVHPQRRAAA